MSDCTDETARANAESEYVKDALRKTLQKQKKYFKSDTARKVRSLVRRLPDKHFDVAHDVRDEVPDEHNQCIVHLVKAPELSSGHYTAKTFVGDNMKASEAAFKAKFSTIVVDEQRGLWRSFPRSRWAHSLKHGHYGRFEAVMYATVFDVKCVRDKNDGKDDDDSGAHTFMFRQRLMNIVDTDKWVVVRYYVADDASSDATTVVPKTETSGKRKRVRGADNGDRQREADRVKSSSSKRQRRSGVHAAAIDDDGDDNTSAQSSVQKARSSSMSALPPSAGGDGSSSSNASPQIDVFDVQSKLASNWTFMLNGELLSMPKRFVTAELIEKIKRAE